MGSMTAEALDLHVTDVTGQREARINDVSRQSSVSELIEGLLGDLGLGHEDTAGRPIVYQARLEREGRQLHGGELVGDALQSGDHLVLQPNIDAGSRS